MVLHLCHDSHSAVIKSSEVNRDFTGKCVGSSRSELVWMCRYCEQLKARTKSAGYTTSELRKGIATGFIFPQALPSTEDIRRLLGNMMLGRPRDAAPQGRGGRRPARDRSTPTPTPTPTSDSKPSDVGVLGSSRDGSEQQNTQAVAGPGDTTTNADLIREVKEVILPPFSVGMDTS